MAEIPADYLRRLLNLPPESFLRLGLGGGEWPPTRQLSHSAAEIEWAARQYPHTTLSNRYAENFLAPADRRRLGQINHSRVYWGRPLLHWSGLRAHRRPIP